MKAVALDRMASNLPEITPETDRWTYEASKAECIAKIVAAENGSSETWAGPNAGKLPFRRGVLIQLPDGSATEVTREHLNRLVADQRHSLQFLMGVAPKEPFSFGTGDPFRSIQFEQVLAYPTELYGCPVIAIGLREP